SQPTTPQRRGSRSQRSRNVGISSGTGTLAAAALPELKSVIVSFGNRVVMRENLEDALYSVLGEQVPAALEPATAQVSKAPIIPGSAEAALKHFNKARDLLRQGDWAGYGKELKVLEEILNQMAAKTPGGTE
ncbi:MAG: hypothetical protein JRI80_16390, partial [Deltaproteobacteria bacterium]|nr:hypothetical protein [Deltaproteobacteria bacterium]